MHATLHIKAISMQDKKKKGNPSKNKYDLIKTVFLRGVCSTIPHNANSFFLKCTCMLSANEQVFRITCESKVEFTMRG